MDTREIAALIIAERDRLNAAIDALQGPTKRRGRPRKDAVTLNGATSAIPTLPARKKRTFTPAQRKKQALAMKAYWEKKRSAKKT
jgi:hypothetical protein